MARELTQTLGPFGRQVIHVDSDGFHNPREIRYRQGRGSARGYYQDAYDFKSLATQTLEPLRGGSGRFAAAVHDLKSDESRVTWGEADADAIVIFDCTFLQRGDLRQMWDEVIYLDVTRGVALERGVARDATALGGREAAREAYETRYMAAYDIYVAEEDPVRRASIVLGYDDPGHPKVRETR